MRSEQLYKRCTIGIIAMSSKYEKEWKRLAKKYPAIEKKKTPFQRFIDKQGYNAIYFIDRINKKRAWDD